MYGFDFAFGIGEDIDPTIGYFTVKEIDYYYLNETDENGNFKKQKVKANVDIVNCSASTFNFTNDSEAEKYGVYD
jgi:hypothetical protein